MKIMNNPPKILLAEDDNFAAAAAAEMLSSDYDLRRVATGQAALNALAEERPDLVLLDVEMPGMSGYEVCRSLRDNPSIGDLPVIFLSGRVSEEDRLAGYEAGGDDYLTKPVSAAELRTKIKLQLASHAERIRLKQDVTGAFSTAMTAMSSTAEIGAVLQFMKTSFSCQDYAALCREVLNTLGAYGLEASVKIYGQQGSVSFSPNGPCSPLEDSVLTNMYKQGRMFEFGSRTSCSYEHITIIVKRVAGDDPERHGRMKDNLALLAEGADTRIVAMDSSATVTRQHAELARLTANTSKALHGIEQSHRAQGIKSNQIFQKLQTKFDNSMIFLGITQSQEEELANMLHDAAGEARALYDEGLKTGAHMESILKQIENVGN
jgi:DNA-binding response OmpR family regulator